jgi:hypothetical protein
MFHFANCEGYIRDAYLIQAITNTVWRTRGLGSDDASSDLCLPNEAEYSFSGTHETTYSEHLEPRLREIELVYYEENPNARTFANPQLHDWVKANRLELLDAVWTLSGTGSTKASPRAAPSPRSKPGAVSRAGS